VRRGGLIRWTSGKVRKEILEKGRKEGDKDSNWMEKWVNRFQGTVLVWEDRTEK
jgi:hypothetical protein